MNNRIVELRMNLYLSHSQFAESIGISLSSLLKIEMGKLTVTDEIVSLVCNKYSVNENWLRFGAGDTFFSFSEQFGSTNLSQLTPLQNSIISNIINLDKELLNDTMLQLSNFFNLISDNIIPNVKNHFLNNHDVSTLSKTNANKKKGEILLFFPITLKKNTV